MSRVPQFKREKIFVPIHEHSDSDSIHREESSVISIADANGANALSFRVGTSEHLLYDGRLGQANCAAGKFAKGRKSGVERLPRF